MNTNSNIGFSLDSETRSQRGTFNPMCEVFPTVSISSQCPVSSVAMLLPCCRLCPATGTDTAWADTQTSKMEFVSWVIISSTKRYVQKIDNCVVYNS